MSISHNSLSLVEFWILWWRTGVFHLGGKLGCSWRFGVLSLFLLSVSLFRFSSAVRNIVPCFSHQWYQESLIMSFTHNEIPQETECSFLTPDIERITRGNVLFRCSADSLFLFAPAFIENSATTIITITTTVTNNRTPITWDNKASVILQFRQASMSSEFTRLWY